MVFISSEVKYFTSDDISFWYHHCYSVDIFVGTISYHGNTVYYSLYLLPLKGQWGPVAQSLTCLATDESLTADPGVTSSIPARSLTFVEIDHETISTVILLPSTESFKKGCCQLQAKVCAQTTG